MMSTAWGAFCLNTLAYIVDCLLARGARVEVCAHVLDVELERLL